MGDVLVKVPVSEQEPKVRATNFEEVCLGYNKEEAMEEASRCLNCKNAQCIKGCPVSIQIPDFIAAVKDGDIEKAYEVISESSALPAVCGRAHRRASVKASVSVESRAKPFPSENWSVSRLTGQEKMASSHRALAKRMVTRSQ